MTNFILQLTSNNQSYKYNFPQEFLDKKYEVGLIKIDGTVEMDNNFIMINSTNNQFIYQKEKIDENKNPSLDIQVVKIPHGKYDPPELFVKIYTLVSRDTGFFKTKIYKGKIILTIDKNYKIDFTSRNSVGRVLGFKNKLLESGENVAEFSFREVIYVDNIFLKCNLIDDTFVNEDVFNSICRISGSKINNEPNQIVYHKVTRTPREINLKLVDIKRKLEIEDFSH